MSSTNYERILSDLQLTLSTDEQLDMTSEMLDLFDETILRKVKAYIDHKLSVIDHDRKWRADQAEQERRMAEERAKAELLCAEMEEHAARMKRMDEHIAELRKANERLAAELGEAAK